MNCSFILVNGDAVGWDGMGGTTGHGSSTLSRKYSLALNHPFTHRDFTSGEVIPEDKSLHSHVCSGRSTQTGVTLTVFTIFKLIQYLQ